MNAQLADYSKVANSDGTVDAILIIADIPDQDDGGGIITYVRGLTSQWTTFSKAEYEALSYGTRQSTSKLYSNLGVRVGYDEQLLVVTRVPATEGDGVGEPSVDRILKGCLNLKAKYEEALLENKRQQEASAAAEKKRREAAQLRKLKKEKETEAEVLQRLLDKKAKGLI